MFQEFHDLNYLQFTVVLTKKFKNSVLYSFLSNEICSFFYYIKCGYFINFFEIFLKILDTNHVVIELPIFFVKFSIKQDNVVKTCFVKIVL